MASFNYVLVVFSHILLAISSSRVSAWTATFEPSANKTLIHMEETVSVNLTIQNLSATDLIREKATIGIISDADILKVSHQILLDDIIDGEWTGVFNVTGAFLGKARLFVEILSERGNIELSNETLTIIIVREEKLIDKIFNISVAVLVSILYINFGAAMDMEKVKEILVRPIGPLIAMVCKFLFMPLLSYFLGIFLFPNNIDMQLGLFFTGLNQFSRNQFETKKFLIFFLIRSHTLRRSLQYLVFAIERQCKCKFARITRKISCKVVFYFYIFSVHWP